MVVTGTTIRIIGEWPSSLERIFCPHCRLTFSGIKAEQAFCPVCKKGRTDGRNLLSPGNKLQCIKCGSIFPKSNNCPLKCTAGH